MQHACFTLKSNDQFAKTTNLRSRQMSTYFSFYAKAFFTLDLCKFAVQ